MRIYQDHESRQLDTQLLIPVRFSGATGIETGGVGMQTVSNPQSRVGITHLARYAPQGCYSPKVPQNYFPQARYALATP